MLEIFLCGGNDLAGQEIEKHILINAFIFLNKKIKGPAEKRLFVKNERRRIIIYQHTKFANVNPFLYCFRLVISIKGPPIFSLARTINRFFPIYIYKEVNDSAEFQFNSQN